jgi:hypothetical protein
MNDLQKHSQEIRDTKESINFADKNRLFAARRALGTRWPMTRAKLVLKITPIPKPLYGVNLRNPKLFKKSHWEAIRGSAIEERGQRCETCGKKIRKSSDIQAHEEWSYDTSTDPATANITRIVLQCRMCHECEHFFRMLNLFENGQLEKRQILDLRKHFCKVNAVGAKDFDRHVRIAWKEWKRLSALRWRVEIPNG